MSKHDKSPSPAPRSPNPFASLGALRDALPSQPASHSPAPKEPPKPALPSKVVVRRERKGHGGKTVTAVAGIPAGQRDTLCDALKKALGCGGRVEGDEIHLQGEIVDRVVEVLEKKGFPKIVRG